LEKAGCFHINIPNFGIEEGKLKRRDIRKLGQQTRQSDLPRRKSKNPNTKKLRNGGKDYLYEAKAETKAGGKGERGVTNRATRHNQQPGGCQKEKRISRGAGNEKYRRTGGRRKKRSIFRDEVDRRSGTKKDQAALVLERK